MNITVETGAIDDAIQTWAEKTLLEAHNLSDELTHLHNDITVSFCDGGIHLFAVYTVESACEPKPEVFQAVVRGATITDLICSILEGDWLDADPVTDGQP